MSNWWVLVTLGEAWLGIGDYSKATEWMARAAKLKESLASTIKTYQSTSRPGSLKRPPGKLHKARELGRNEKAFRRTQLEASAPWGVVKALSGKRQ